MHSLTFASQPYFRSECTFLDFRSQKTIIIIFASYLSFWKILSFPTPRWFRSVKHSTTENLLWNTNTKNSYTVKILAWDFKVLKKVCSLVANFIVLQRQKNLEKSYVGGADEKMKRYRAWNRYRSNINIYLFLTLERDKVMRISMNSDKLRSQT